MTLPTWKTDCGCTQVVAMGQKRERLCEHGRLFEKVRDDGEAKPKHGSTLSRGMGFAASPAQRKKVKRMACVGCGREASAGWAIDPAHLWPRGQGGCDSPDCVLPLCRLEATGEGCHRLFDEGRLELLERLADSEAWQLEQAHPMLAHGVSPVELVRRLSGGSYDFVRVEEQAEQQEKPTNTRRGGEKDASTSACTTTAKQRRQPSPAGDSSRASSRSVGQSGSPSARPSASSAPSPSSSSGGERAEQVTQPSSETTTNPGGEDG